MERFIASIPKRVHSFVRWSIALGFTCSLSYSQGVSVNTTGTRADTSAAFDISSTTQGMLVPRMTAAQRSAIVLPATGLIVYQTDGTAGFYHNTGTPEVPSWVILLNSGTSAGGDLSGTYPSPTLSSTGVTPGTYGSTGMIPQVAIDAHGRITSASNVPLDIYGCGMGAGTGSDHVTISGSQMITPYFKYRGSSFYGSSSIVFSVDCGGGDGASVFLITLIDVTHGATVATKTLINVAYGSVTEVQADTYSLIPASESFFQVQAQRLSGSGSLNIYYVQLRQQ